MKLIILLMMSIILSGCCTGNNCCVCGYCEGVFSNCNDCQCLGMSSEGCHMSDWNESSPCCNESSTMSECHRYLDNEK